MVSAFLFRDESVSPAQRAVLAVLYAALGVSVLGCLIGIGLGLRAGLPDDLFIEWLPALAASIAAILATWRVVAVREQRRIWIPLAAGLVFYAAATLLRAVWLGDLVDEPFPSIADPLRLLIYPLGVTSVLLVSRAQVDRVRTNASLDGLITALGTAALFAAIHGPIEIPDDATATAMLTTFLYPLGDLLIVGVLVAGLSIRGWRVTASTLALGTGLLALTAGDALHLREMVAGDYVPSSAAVLIWVLGLALLAIAPWARIRLLPPLQEAGRFAARLPTVVALVAVGIHVVDQFEPLSPAALAFSTATLIVAVTRLAGSSREEALLHLSRREALTDELTGLPNRRALIARATELLETDDSGQEKRAVLMLIDLNDFKEFNDTLGHGAGDDLLSALGLRMKNQLRPGDFLARLGGDEFAVLLDDFDDPADAEATAWRMLSVMEEPFSIHDIQVRAGASIGIACAPLHGHSYRELYRCADLAMYRAKTARTGVHVHDGDLDQGLVDRSIDRLALAGELQRAFAEDEIVAFIQPQVDPLTGQLTGAEALARWEHPTRGTLAPIHFINAVEQMNVSRRLTLRMFETTADLAASCVAAGLDLSIAVNLTAANLMDDALVDDLSRILNRRGLPFDRMRLEVTEGTVMADAGRAIDLLKRVRALHIGVSLDDFGTDHSSLSYLNRLPVDELKIDRSFIAEMATDPRTAAIVSSSLALARTLGIRSTAEGVEDPETLAMLAEMGCDTAQGYFIARPMPSEAFVGWALAHESARQAVSDAVA